MAPKRQRFARRRKAVGYTQESFAERLDVDRNTVVRWEGGVTEPQPWMRPRIARALEVSVDELDRLLAEAIEPAYALMHPSSVDLVAAASDGNPVIRAARDAPAGTGAGGAAASDEGESVLDIAARMGWLGSVNAGDVTLDPLDAAAEDIVARYGLEGPGILAPEVVRLRRHVQELLQGHQHPRQRLRLYALAGRLSAMLGYLAVGQDRYTLASAYCGEAFTLATAAEDPDLQAWVRGTESLSAYYQKRYTDALELARDGQRYAHGGPQMIRLVINGEARALGRLGERSDIDEAVARAYAGVARLPHRAGMSSCISLEPYSEARVEANAATAHLSLGATPKVLDYAATIESPVEESRVDWDRSLVRLDVATALICQQRPDVEHAAGIARSALEESVGKPIEPVRQRAAEFVAQARRWQTRPAMRELAEALRGWNATPLPVPGS